MVPIYCAAMATNNDEHWKLILQNSAEMNMKYVQTFLFPPVCSPPLIMAQLLVDGAQISTLKLPLATLTIVFPTKQSDNYMNEGCSCIIIA